MNRSIKILSLLAVAALAAPVAMAGWMSYGSHEPDIAEDAASGWMWAEAPGAESQGKQVYLNVFGGIGGALVPQWAPNPNVAALDTAFRPTNQIFKAVLGVWKDCNGDGYMGLAESAAHAYRIELALHDETVCPQDTTSAQSHNDGVWIREMIPIGLTNDVLNTTDTDPAVYIDDLAMIWGDAGSPGENLAATGSGGSCPISPLPRGTMQSTGGLMKYASCSVNWVAVYNDAVLRVDPENEQGLAFEDADRPDQPGHPLNQPTLGPEDSEERAVTVWDCTEGSETVKQEYVNPVTGETGNVTVYGIAFNPGPGGSFAGAVNHTLEGAIGDCDTTNDAGGDVYGPEGDHEGDSTTSKSASNWNFRFYRAAFHPGYGVCTDDLILTGDGLCPDGGVRLPDPGSTDLGAQPLQAATGTYWSSNAILIGTTPGIPVRHGLLVDTDDPGASDLEPNPRTGANPLYFSFYAFVGNAGGLGLVLPGGGATGTYANEWCNGADTGIKFGVDCDADNWNRNAADGSAMIVPTGMRKFAVPGDEYNLRDVDCYDTTFQGFEGDGCKTQPLPAPATE